MKRKFDGLFSILCGLSCMLSVPFKFNKYIYFDLSFRYPIIALLLHTIVTSFFLTFYILSCGALYFIRSFLDKKFTNQALYLDMIEDYRLGKTWEDLHSKCNTENIEFRPVFLEVYKMKKLLNNASFKAADSKNLKLPDSLELQQQG